MGDLETALSLSAAGEGIWHGVADRHYEANTGMYGGMTAALLMKSVVSENRVAGSPLSLNVSFVRMLPPGSAVELRTQLLGATRSIQHWSASIFVRGSDEVSATALVVMGARRGGDDLTDMKMPDAQAPETIAPFEPPGTFGKQSPVRMAIGDFSKAVAQGRTYSAGWIREVSGRRIDAVQIAYLCDNYPPRAFFLGTGPRPSSTLSYNVYFVAPEADVGVLGDEFTLLEAFGTRGADGVFGTRANLWSRAGKLIATTEQAAWFR